VPDILRDELGRHLFIEQVDIIDLSSIDVIGKKYTITHVIHLAAPKIGALSIGEDLQTNITGLFNVLRVSKEWSVQRIVIASSIGVYGMASNPLSENVPLSMSGANPIAANKKIFEIIGDTFALHEQMDVAFVRPSAIWGPLGRSRSMFFSLPQMAYAAAGDADRDSLGKIYAEDGIDMCYVKDCGKAVALVAMSENLSQRTYNIGGGKAVTNAEIASKIQAVMPSVKFDLLEGANPQSVTENPYMDISALEALGFEPDYDLRQGLEDYMQWIQASDRQ
jgi:UDP-glucose 4-epimerase